MADPARQIVEWQTEFMKIALSFAEALLLWVFAGLFLVVPGHLDEARVAAIVISGTGAIAVAIVLQRELNRADGKRRFGTPLVFCAIVFAIAAFYMLFY